MSENLKWSEYDFTKIPFDDLVRVGQRTMLYRDMFTVSWLLGRFCNYRCSYCWPYARSDKKDHRPTELCLLTIDEIRSRHVKEDSTVSILAFQEVNQLSILVTLIYLNTLQMT